MLFNFIPVVALLFIYFFNLGVWNPVEAVHSYFILLFFLSLFNTFGLKT